MSTPLSKTEEKYHHDSMFHAVVDAMQKLILDLQLSPGEVREAAMFAAYLVEMRHPRPMTFAAARFACRHCGDVYTGMPLDPCGGNSHHVWEPVPTGGEGT